MPIYETKQRVTHGLPFGGIGAGKIEVTPQGLFNAFTIQNNWPDPLLGRDGYPGVLGFHLGFFVETPAKRKAFLLQTAPVQNIPTVKNIRYEGSFPSATLKYLEPGLGVEIALEVFSSWAAGNAKDSGLPAVFFNLKVVNKNRYPVKIGFLFIGRNICGEWCVGRQNRISSDQRSVSVEFSNVDPASRDARQGGMRFSFSKKNWKMSFMESWNAVTKNFSFTPENISLAAWPYFAKEEDLPDTKPGFTAQGENQELCSAVMAVRTLRPGARAELPFNASWYFPNHPFGHYYQKSFKNAGEVTRYISPRQKGIYGKIKKFEAAVFKFPFPRWFNDALLANLAPFVASSWHTKDGRFSFYEAPVVCPLMGTVDVGFYGSVPASYFFPELEKSLMTQFAKAQRKDGYIPHDLGKNRLDLPSNGTTYYYWKDLNPKFILMVYRDYLWSGDRSFLQNMYSPVKKALAWSLKTDFDGNGLPDNEGEDQTFDLWEFRGTTAYTSGIFLAALLACEKMAVILKDAAFAADCREFFLKGSRSFDRELWNGQYFGDTCSLSQLNGQWYADLLGLPPIAEKQKIRQAIQSIWKRNRSLSSFGMINSTMPNGRVDVSNNHSKNIWLGMNYAFLSLALMHGLPLKDLLKIAYKLWNNVTNVKKSPWNMPDMIDAKTGQYLFGDYYYRNMAIWSIPIAYAKKDKRTAAILRSLRSH